MRESFDPYQFSVGKKSLIRRVNSLSDKMQPKQLVPQFLVTQDVIQLPPVKLPEGFVCWS